jgi:tetratricopeptide (TPR) repeat protein
MPKRAREAEDGGRAEPPQKRPSSGDDADTDESAPRCWICFESEHRSTRSRRMELASMGCACRGSAGMVHLGCLVSMATHSPECWTNCPTCKQAYKSTMIVPLAQARQRLADRLPRDADGVHEYEHERLCAMHGMAIALEEMGRFHEARPLYETVLQIEIALHGPDDLSTLLTKNNLADLLDRVGERAEARQMYEAVIAAETAKLGPDHEHTLGSKGNLASLLEVSGERKEARKLFEEVIEGNTRLLGAQHADTLRVKGNLANVIKQLGEKAEAQQLYRDVVRDQSRLLGPWHADTLNTKANLAFMLGENGDAEGAKTLFASVIEGNTRQLGAAHVDTLVDRGNLAELQVLIGELRPAAQTLPTIISELSKQLAEGNRFTLIYRSAQALLWQKQGRVAAAEAAFAEILPLQEAIGGPDDSYAGKTRRRLEYLQRGCVVPYPEDGRAPS